MPFPQWEKIDDPL